jgi:hypothetical protein
MKPMPGFRVADGPEDHSGRPGGNGEGPHERALLRGSGSEPEEDCEIVRFPAGQLLRTAPHVPASSHLSLIDRPLSVEPID